MDINVIWIIAIVVFIVLESLTYQLVSIWFVFGAIGGMIASFCGTHFYIQMAIFLAISIIMLVALRPVSMKLVKRQDFKSNADGLVGKNVLITQEVSNIKGTGQGKVNGMHWTVRSESDEVIPAGTIVEIKKIEGVKLIVG